MGVRNICTPLMVNKKRWVTSDVLSLLGEPRFGCVDLPGLILGFDDEAPVEVSLKHNNINFNNSFFMRFCFFGQFQFPYKHIVDGDSVVVFDQLVPVVSLFVDVGHPNLALKGFDGIVDFDA